MFAGCAMVETVRLLRYDAGFYDKQASSSSTDFDYVIIRFRFCQTSPECYLCFPQVVYCLEFRGAQPTFPDCCGRKQTGQANVCQLIRHRVLNHRFIVSGDNAMYLSRHALQAFTVSRLEICTTRD